MREQECLRCARQRTRELSVGFGHHEQGMVRVGGGGPFALPGARAQYAPDRPFLLVSIALDLEISPREKVLKSLCKLRIRTLAPDQREVVLDQVGLFIQEVAVDGRSQEFFAEDGKLRVTLPSSPAPGDEWEISVRYEARNPRRGMYFTGPDKDYPNKPYQVWTQGEDEDNRFWIPLFDHPSQRASVSSVIRVPAGFTAISNGALISKKVAPTGNTFEYSLATPIVPYLITLVVGEFSEWQDKGPRGLPIQYFTVPGREEDGKRAFSNTPDMLKAFESLIGRPYPFEKYSQVAVQDFIFGGMENASATTQTDQTLHDARAHLDFSSDPLVSHELAHQWFGDLLTCRDWAHGWLNEGFATFFERVWIEKNPGPDGGMDEAKYYSYQDLKAYLEEDQTEYRRPIVCNTYTNPIELFDTHLYQKGGLVLNLLRFILGEEAFWASIRLYVSRYEGKNVETLDLIRAIDDQTGRNLRQVFDEWVFGAGYPEFELSFQWDEKNKQAEIGVEQKQTDGKPKVEKNGIVTHVFHLPAILELTLPGGKTQSFRVQLGEPRERLLLPCTEKPLMVRFDPENWIPKTLKFPRPREMLVYQLKHDRDCMGRIEAAHELAERADAAVVEALAEQLISDPFWGVKAEIARALSKIRMEQSKEALIKALRSLDPKKNAKARKVIVGALGSFKDVASTDQIRAIAKKDPSYYVEAEAIAALPKGLLKEEDRELEDFLISQLEKESHNDVIRRSALRALSELDGIERGHYDRAFEAILTWTQRGKLPTARVGAILALGRMGRIGIPSRKARVLEVLRRIADEEDFRVRHGVVAAAVQMDTPEVIPILDRIERNDLDGRILRGCRAAILALRGSGPVNEKVENLRKDFNQLDSEYRQLKTQLENVQAKLSPRASLIAGRSSGKKSKASKRGKSPSRAHRTR